MFWQSHSETPREGGSLPSARACASSCSHVRIVELVSPCLHRLVYAREATQAVKAHNDVIDAIFAQVDAADALRRQCTWVGMPLAPRAARTITPEVRADAWARHGLT